MGVGRTGWAACRAVVVAGLLLGAAGAGAQDGAHADVAEDISPFLSSAQTAIAEERYEDAISAVDGVMGLRLLTPEELGVALYLRGRASYQLGDAQTALGDWTRALDEGALPSAQRDALERAVAQLQDYLSDDTLGGDQGVDAGLMQRAMEALQSGDFARSRDLSERVIANAEARGDTLETLQALSLLENAARGERDWDATFDIAERAVDVAQTLDQPLAAMIALGTKGEAAVAADRLDVAADALTRLLEAGDALGDHPGPYELFQIEHANMMLANLALRGGDHQEAERRNQRALELADDRAPASPALAAMGRQLHMGELMNAIILARIRGDDAEARRRLGQLQGEAEDADGPRAGAQALEHAGAGAHRLGEDETGCWLENRAAQRYRELGMADDADDMRALLSDEGCFESASDGASP